MSSHNVELRFNDRTLLLCSDKLSSLFEMSKADLPIVRFAGLLEKFDFELAAKVGERNPVRLFPKPSLLTRLFSSKVRQLNRSSH
jgi:hypothetical protein